MKPLESIREEIWEEMRCLEDKRKDQWADIKYQTLREVLQKLGHLDSGRRLIKEETEVNKVMKWFKKKLDDIENNTPALHNHDAIWMLNRVHELYDQLDETEDLTEEMKQPALINYLTELETMTKQLIEGLQVKLVRDSLDRCSEAYLEGKLIEKKRLLFIIKDVKSLYNTEQRDQTNYKQMMQALIDADEREMW